MYINQNTIQNLHSNMSSLSLHSKQFVSDNQKSL